MAVPMILILAVLLASGTIVESKYSTAVAKRFVYGTWWFAAFLTLLGANVFCSALSRFPWKKHQTGFVITHLGILILLSGSLVTQRYGVDGQIGLTEGEEGALFQEEKPTLYYQLADGPIEVFPAAFNFRNPSPEHPSLYHPSQGGILMVDRFYLNARKLTRARAAETGEKGFPSVHIRLDSSFVHEDQWLFLGNEGLGHLDLGPASVFFEREDEWKKRVAGGAKSMAPNALAVLVAADGSLKYQLRHRCAFGGIGPLKAGESLSTGWMDMQFQVEERQSAAVPEETYEPVPLPSQKDPEPAIHYEVLRYPDKKGGWLGYPSQAAFPFLGKTLSLAYGPRQVRLPFSIKLQKFNLGFDPGTQKPASYASDIVYTDPEKGTQIPAAISMNQPLRYRGYAVYQASYSSLPDGKFVSVFSVGKDPGIWIKYGGALVMVLGIIFMFWFKNPAWKKKGTNV